MQQLGGDDRGRISFDEFVHCRMRLITEIEQEKLRERGLMELSGHKGTATGSNFSWGSGQGDNVLGKSNVYLIKLGVHKSIMNVLL